MPEPIRPEPTPGLTPLVSMFPLHINDEPATPPKAPRPQPERGPAMAGPAHQPLRQPGR